MTALAVAALVGAIAAIVGWSAWRRSSAESTRLATLLDRQAKAHTEEADRLRAQVATVDAALRREREITAGLRVDLKAIAETREAEETAARTAAAPILGAQGAEAVAAAINRRRGRG